MTRQNAIAIIGMNGRFPKSPDVAALWANLCADRDLRTRFAAGGRNGAPNHVAAGYPLEDADRFDADFFQISPKEARQMDPQHRVALECAWNLMEEAGYGGAADGAHVGVFLSSAFNGYLHFLSDHDLPSDSASYFEMLTAGDKDYLATRISYKLGLTGPSLSVQTACSSSLVAVALACQALLDLQCDMAIAGGVCIRVPQDSGYHYEPGGALSPDGRCRPFDKSAAGTVGGNGCGLVLLKRLEDALADGDEISAVICSQAMNNDGAGKVGFTAPALAGQKAVLAEALEMAEIDPATVCYVEAHGTGTPLGDPIEIEALNAVYGERRETPCLIGSIKGNIGHLDTAAGISGLIKAARVLETGLVPPTQNFQEANPDIAFEAGPFRVAQALTPLPKDVPGDGVRRAAVSSFGFGGTNVHMILEEAPRAPAPGEPNGAAKGEPALLPLSARSADALKARAGSLAADLERLQDEDLPALAETLQKGRRVMAVRAAGSVCDLNEARAFLGGLARTPPEDLVATPPRRPRLVYLLPGQGSQFPGMAQPLYEENEAFRERLRTCLDLAGAECDAELGALLLDRASPADVLTGTRNAQLAIFCLQQALAAALEAEGLYPDGLLGHSLGEISAATIAGTFSLEDAIRLVARRGELMASQPPGAMLAVAAGEDALRAFLTEGGEGPGKVEISAVNAPERLTLSGPEAAIEALEAGLAAAGLAHGRLETSHAFHSEMMAEAAAALSKAVQDLPRRTPGLPWISNVTGAAITAAEATSADYWARQLRSPVRFAEGCRGLVGADQTACLFLELGPQNGLLRLVRANAPDLPERALVSLYPGKGQPVSAADYGKALARLWQGGAEIAWSRRRASRPAPRKRLSGYPFRGQRHWADRPAGPGAPRPEQTAREDQAPAREPLAKWFYVPQWQDLRQALPSDDPRPAAHWAGKRCLLVQSRESALAASLKSGLEAWQADVGVVGPDGEALDTPATSQPALSADHVFLIGEPSTEGGDAEGARLFDRLLGVLRGLGTDSEEAAVHLHLLARVPEATAPGARDLPFHALALGGTKAALLEFPRVAFSAFELASGDLDATAARLLRDPLVLGLEDVSDAGWLPARRLTRGRRQTLDYLNLPLDDGGGPVFEEDGVYLILGGLSGIGLELAKHAALTSRALLAVTSRDALPPEAGWAAAIAEACRGEPRDDPRSERLRAAFQLRERMGDRVAFLPCRLEDKRSLAACLDEVKRRWGPLRGVIHSAGVPGGGMIAAGLPEGARSNFPAKVQGAANLRELLWETPLDFVIFNSSLSAIQGAVGQADNCAANQFLDAVAGQGFPRARRTLSINWDRWRGVGMAVAVERRHRALTGEDFHAFLTAAEGVECLARALAAGHSQIAVSTLDLKRESRRLRAQQAGGVIERLRDRAQDPAQGGGAPRPELDTPFAAPRDEIETLLADVLAQNLGFDRVGIHDGYTDLGGDSLMALSLSKAINQAFRTRLPLAALFRAGTVAGMAEALKRQEAKPGITAKVAAARLRLAGMSAAEKRALLAEGSAAALENSEPAA